MVCDADSLSQRGRCCLRLSSTTTHFLFVFFQFVLENNINDRQSPASGDARLQCRAPTVTYSMISTSLSVGRGPVGREGAVDGVVLDFNTCPSGPEREVNVGAESGCSCDRTSAKVMAEMSWITLYPGESPSAKISIMGELLEEPAGVRISFVSGATEVRREGGWLPGGESSTFPDESAGGRAKTRLAATPGLIKASMSIDDTSFRAHDDKSLPFIPIKMSPVSNPARSATDFGLTELVRIPIVDSTSSSPIGGASSLSAITTSRRLYPCLPSSFIFRPVFHSAESRFKIVYGQKSSRLETRI